MPAGRSTLQFKYENTGDHCGKGTLLINGVEAGSGLIERTAKSHFYISQGASCGCDPAPTVTNAYAAPFTFTGTLHKVVVDVDGPPGSTNEGDWHNIMLEQ